MHGCMVYDRQPIVPGEVDRGQGCVLHKPVKEHTSTHIPESVEAHVELAQGAVVVEGTAQE